ncbi:MAG: serine hydrolase, partial [Candidatus Eremiobacteraeota bacterium]|nr:serine hydrolase [Candidatus Eremiobacteraeota bacterium]
GALPLIDDPEATGRNSHPAADAAALFAAIAQRAIPGAALLLEMLGRQRWNEKLARGLQPGDRFCHKTGDTDEVTHDGGILETAQGRRYVLVVYTALPSSPQGDARFVQFMDALRPLL